MNDKVTIKVETDTMKVIIYKVSQGYKSYSLVHKTAMNMYPSRREEPKSCQGFMPRRRLIFEMKAYLRLKNSPPPNPAPQPLSPNTTLISVPKGGGNQNFKTGLGQGGGFGFI